MTEEQLMIERRELNRKLDERTEKILQILNGNGHMGLCAKVDVLWGVGLFLSAAVVGAWIKILF